MELSNVFPFWERLSAEQRQRLTEGAVLRTARAGALPHQGGADCLGTAREVVTRMLRYFQSEGMVRLTRGAVELTDPERLRRLGDG